MCPPTSPIPPAEASRTPPLSARQPSYSQQILTAAREAFIAGWQHTMWVGVAVMAALVLFILIRGPKAAPAADTDPSSGIAETSDDPTTEVTSADEAAESTEVTR